MGVGGIKRSSRTQGIIRNPPGERKVEGFDSSRNAPSPSFPSFAILGAERCVTSQIRLCVAELTFSPRGAGVGIVLTSVSCIGTQDKCK